MRSISILSSMAAIALAESVRLDAEVAMAYDENTLNPSFPMDDFLLDPDRRYYVESVGMPNLHGEGRRRSHWGGQMYSNKLEKRRAKNKAARKARRRNK